MTKAELEKKKSLARTLYMAGKDQAEIADQIDVSRQTISKWAQQEGWREQRAATAVTRPELVNKLLHSIDTLITEVNASGDVAQIAGLGDKLAKMSAVIEKLDKKANVVDAIEVFMAFSKWMQFRAQTDKNITPELLKTFNYYQDLFISEKMSTGFSCDL
nr:MAG TPA: terminase ATPase subunit [Caudoviricetes sp.]